MAQSGSGSIFGRIWSGFWHFVDSARRITINLLFLIAVILLLRLLSAGEQTIHTQEKTTLVLRPVGQVVEQYSGYPIDRAIAAITGEENPETQLRDLLQALELARDDENISQILIDTNQLSGIGLANLEELAHAIDEFRASGKPIYAMGSIFFQNQYFLASLADEIWFDPEGFLWFEGFSYYRNYYKAGLDKLAVDINLFRVGAYKSAIEPYIRDDMSAADREAAQYLMDDLWNRYLGAIAMRRGLPIEVLDRFTQNYADQVIGAGGDAPRAALETGLIDRLLTWPEARTELARSGAKDSKKGFRQIDFLDYVATQQPLLPSTKDRVGIIVAEGTINGGEQPPGTVGAESTAALLRKAGRAQEIKAVVLRINSPGGDALASEEIRREMLALKEAGKPIVVSMGNLAASGGYWIAMGADEVWANASSITGSIGIFGMIPTFQRTLDKIGIHTDGVGTTPLSGGVRPDRELNGQAGQMIQAIIEDGYADFINLVSTHRQMTPQEIHEVAQGRVWTGKQALNRQLVDQTGGLGEAIDAAARRAGLGDNYGTSYIEQQLSSLEQWLVQTTSSALIATGIDLPRRNTLWQTTAFGMMTKNSAIMRRIWQDSQILLNAPPHPQILAHCFCAAP